MPDTKLPFEPDTDLTVGDIALVYYEGTAVAVELHENLDGEAEGQVVDRQAVTDEFPQGPEEGEAVEITAEDVIGTR